MTTRWTACSRTSLGRSSVVPISATLPVAVPRRAVVAIDEPDDAQAVLGVLVDLVREHVRHAARSDDDDVLDVCRLPSPDRAAHGAEERHEDDGKQPEDNEPRRGSGYGKPETCVMTRKLHVPSVTT